MKILLTMHMPYFPTFGGANKNNRLIAEALAQKGHSVLVVVPLLGTEPDQLAREQFIKEQTFQGINLTPQHGVYSFHWKGVQVYAVEDSSVFHTHLVQQIYQFCPDCLLIALEEPEQKLLEIVLDIFKIPIVGIAQTPSLLPFGPNSFFTSSTKTRLIESLTAVVASSNFIANYIEKWSCIKPIMIYMPVYGSEPFLYFKNFNKGFVTMINPCDIKGISIFLDLVKRLPKVKFAAVPTWGTSEENKIILSQFKNLYLLEPCSDIEIILSKSKIILMPSLWLENFPLTVIEAMLRGIPVISSNVGGIPEVKLGTDFILSVNPIKDFTFYEDTNGKRHFNPIVPRQDIIPWSKTLTNILSNEIMYYSQAEFMRNTALKFIQSLSIEPLESLLINLAKTV